MPVDLEVLKELRKDKRLTQEQMGELFGIKASSYSNYETGRRKISIDMLETIADKLGTSTDYILGRTAIDKPYPPRAANK